DGREVLFEVLAPSGVCFTSQVIHRHDHGQFLAGRAGKELTDRVAFLGRDGLDALDQRVRELDGQRAHGLLPIRFKNSRGESAVTPSCSEPRKSFALSVIICGQPAANASSSTISSSASGRNGRHRKWIS